VVVADSAHSLKPLLNRIERAVNGLAKAAANREKLRLTGTFTAFALKRQALAAGFP
jgi:hypothetical protein